MLKKYRKIPLILTGLAGIAFLTTGFSAWVIQGTNAATENNMVTIKVGTLTDKRLTTTLSSLDKNRCFIILCRYRGRSCMSISRLS